ncbi:MAG: hypothetical protein U9N36_01220, partial [Euryarchaeota archaeon]|nr:hypothetical protein [Euryarchaeota archaeon]
MKIRTITVAIIMMLLVVVMGMIAVMPATAATATRTLPVDCVNAGENFTVTIEADNYGGVGAVMETLCNGWKYKGVTGDVDAVKTVDNTVVFLLMGIGPRTFTYTVSAPDDQGACCPISGIIRDVERVDYTVTGATEVCVGGDPPDPISATRDISDRTVEAGSTFVVTITLTANEDIQAPMMDENLPTGWAVTVVDNGGAAYRTSTTEWVWMTAMSSGETRTVVYEVTVPAGTTPQDYDITGQTSAYAVDPVDISAESIVTIESRTTVDPISATRNISDRTVEAGSTFTVTLTLTANEDIQAPTLDENLLTGWTVTEVSNDGATYKAATTEWVWTTAMSSGETRTVIYDVTVPAGTMPQDYRITGQASAHEVSPSTIGGESAVTIESGTTVDLIAATRNISDRMVEAGSTFVVTLTLTANEDIQAPTLDENLPTGWTVTEVSNDGATYKAATTEWVWMAAMPSGETRTVVYEVTVPAGTTPQDYDITGQTSAYAVDPVDISGGSIVTIESRTTVDPISATRDISDRTVEAGSTFVVTLTLTANEDIQAPTLDENLPTGWTVTEVSNDGA